MTLTIRYLREIIAALQKGPSMCSGCKFSAASSDRGSLLAWAVQKVRLSRLLKALLPGSLLPSDFGLSTTKDVGRLRIYISIKIQLRLVSQKLSIPVNSVQMYFV